MGDIMLLHSSLDSVVVMDKQTKVDIYLNSQYAVMLFGNPLRTSLITHFVHLMDRNYSLDEFVENTVL